MPGQTPLSDDVRLSRIEEGLARLDGRVTALADELQDYVEYQDQWFNGLSQCVAGAAAVLADFERYAGMLKVRAAKGVWLCEEPVVGGS